LEFRQSCAGKNDHRPRRAVRALTALALSGPAVLFITGSAHAESAPGCSSTVQIGSTGYVVVDGQTFASVKQFVGCGQNWGYVYVWQGWRDTHSSWSVCADVTDLNTGATDGFNCGGTNPVEVWSFGTNTVNDCTKAQGWGPDGIYSDSHAAYSSEVC